MVKLQFNLSVDRVLYNEYKRILKKLTNDKIKITRFNTELFEKAIREIIKNYQEGKEVLEKNGILL